MKEDFVEDGLVNDPNRSKTFVWAKKVEGPHARLHNSDKKPDLEVREGGFRVENGFHVLVS